MSAIADKIDQAAAAFRSTTKPWSIVSKWTKTQIDNSNWGKGFTLLEQAKALANQAPSTPADNSYDNGLYDS